MSNSPLVSYTKFSPNKSSRNGQRITKITPHHMAGNLSVESCGNVFANPSAQASANYGIGSDGRIGLYVPESERAWTSANGANDRQSVTIEVANSSVGGDWPVSDKAWESLINLCVDICQRNGIKGLTWTGDANGTLTCHYMFAPTACPGPYLKSRMGKLANVVNARLDNGFKPSAPSTPAQSAPAAGKLSVDGYWGVNTTKAVQKALGTIQDGIVSGQDASDMAKVNKGGLETSSWKIGTTGSNMVRALQNRLGVKIDGFFGVNTCKALQRYLGTTPDGVVSKPSLMVKELQRRLNSGKF